MRENIEDKGRRLVTEGRLTIMRLDPERGLIVATCRGTDDIYDLGFDPAKCEWRCTCPARKRCAHLVGLQLVTTRPTP